MTRSFCLSLAVGLLGPACSKQSADTVPAAGASTQPSAAASATHGPSTSSEDPAEAIKAALAGPHRSPENRARDHYRHPLETLTFFGLRPDMTVIELWPGGGGWYTEVLAPALAETGKLMVTNFDENGPPDAYPTQSAKKLKDKLAGNQDGDRPVHC